MSKIRVGLVGVGAIAELHLPVLLSMPDVEECWVADLNAKRAQDIAFADQTKAVPLTSPDQLPDCDVMFLATPPGAPLDLSQPFEPTLTLSLLDEECYPLPNDKEQPPFLPVLPNTNSHHMTA